MSTFPESLYRLLIQIDSHPSRQVRYEDILAAGLINALQIGRHHKLIDSSTDDPDILFRTAHGGNPIYSLTSAGQCELAMYRDKSAVPSEQPAPVVDDSKWPRPVDVQRGLELPNRTAVGRLVENGELKDNGREGRDRRIDPVSILDYCNRKGAVWSGESLSGVTDS